MGVEEEVREEVIGEKKEMTPLEIVIYKNKDNGSGGNSGEGNNSNGRGYGGDRMEAFASFQYWGLFV